MNAKNEKVAKCAIKKDKDFLYYVDDNGDICRTKMTGEGRQDSEVQTVLQLGLQKASGFLYFIDEAGDVSRTPQS